MKSFWIKCLASLVCFCAVLWWADAPAVWAQLRAADPGWIAVAVGALTLATLAMAHRWQHVARRFGIQIGFGSSVREYYLGQLVNIALPGGIAGDVTRAVRTRHAADLARATQSVMAERLLGQLAMLTFMFMGFVMAAIMPGGVLWGRLGDVVLLILVCLAVTLLVLSRGNHATARFLKTAGSLLTSPVIAAHGVITTLCLVIAFYACARAVGTNIPPEGWATLIPLTLCAMLIPLSIAGWGWREGAAAALFPFVGAPASAGIATGITYGVVLMIATLPALILLFTDTRIETRSAKRTANTP